MTRRFSFAATIGFLTPAFLALAPAAGVAAERDWAAQVEVGSYELHTAADGLLLGGRLQRSWAPLILDAGVTAGRGDRGFVAVDLGCGLRTSRGRLSLSVGIGAGVMYEMVGGDGSLGQPYYRQGAVEWRLDEAVHLRLAVRRGRHGSFGDEGTWEGPDVVLVGCRFEL